MDIRLAAPRWRLLVGTNEFLHKPMRHEGITLYQASWAPPAPGGRPSSGFAIVQNPSDQWPKWSLYIASFGRMLHFGMKLFRFLSSSLPSKKSDA